MCYLKSLEGCEVCNLRPASDICKRSVWLSQDQDYEEADICLQRPPGEISILLCSIFNYSMTTR